MKNKPLRHKESNRFKFKRFGDRISEIDIDVFHRIVHKNEESSDDEEELVTIFHKTLVKWNVLNLTEGYTNFRKEVKHIVTLPQLLHHKHQVMESLKKYLKMKDVAFLQPVLEMVVAAARDLQRDFYEFFPDFLTLIIDLLNTKDPDVLEYAFTSLAYLFKFMWVYFIRNIDTTFEILLPLLVDTKPVYINNFAAESFAFVARKITGQDQNSFLNLLFNALERNPHGVKGCGKLLFEVISGVPGKFHSCAEKMINLYFKTLTDDKIDPKLAFDVLSEIFMCINNSISPNHSQVLWDVIFKTLDQNLSEENDKSGRILIPVAQLIRIILNHKGGRMLSSPASLSSLITRGISIYENKSDLILMEFIEMSVSILLADNIKLSQETSYELISKLLSISKKSILKEIIEKLISHSSFETQVLSMATQRSVLRRDFNDGDLNLFAKIVLKRAPPMLNGINIDKWRKINLDLRTFPNDTVTYLVEMLKKWEDEDKIICEDSLKVITILPHVNISLHHQLVEAIKQTFASMFLKLIEMEVDEDILSTDETEKRTFAFLLTLESIIRLLNEDDLHQVFEESKVDFKNLISRYSNNSNILNAVDLFYSRISSTKYKDKYINVETFDFFNAHLARRLASPYRHVRLSICHFYYLFKDLNICNNSNEDFNNVLELLFMAESIEVSVQSYRERLTHLQALSFGSRSLIHFEKKYYQLPLYFLLGNLFINFSLLWDPVCKIIATYANEKCADFWPIFVGELQENNNKKSSICSAGDLFKCDILNELSKSLIINDKPDYDNYKSLLWNCMNEFPEYCEMKNRDLTPLFINFVENNFFTTDSETAKSFSIEKKIKDLEIIQEIEEDDDEDDKAQDEDDKIKEKDKENEDKSVQKIKVIKIGKTSNFKLLLAQLKLFSKMHNPKYLYREQEMYRIYMDLLLSKNMELQKAILDCIFTYKLSELIPYKSHIYGLIDEKNIRNELARFKIIDDEETSETIKPEERKVLMPILMRIIYAKMVTRGTGRAAGAAGGSARRKIIVRFLMGVKEEEMMLFAEMACKPFERYQINFFADNQFTDIRNLTTNISKNLDLSNIIPPKRLRSAINLLSIMIEEFGAKMSKNLLPRLLAILLCALAQIKGILDRSENVLSGFLSIIKELRNTCIGILARFFEHFENYDWSQSELDALFDVAVFPWLEKFPTEGIHSPTVLLKLFSAWCNNSRYYCLLIKHKDEDKNITCLPFIIKLLLGEKTHYSVTNTILEMINYLLTLQDYEKMETDESEKMPCVPLQPKNILQVNPEAVLPEKFLNYGSAILLPHVPDILQFMKRKLLKSKMGVKKIEASILSRISELNLNPETSSALISLLIPILVRRASRGESDIIIEELLTTIINLLKNVHKPEEHTRSLLPLLFHISSLPLRKSLLELFQTIASNSTNTETVSKDILLRNVKLLISLNAMDQRWVEQADFEKRLDAFQQINSFISSDDTEVSKTLTLEFGIALLYNCYYFLKHETDLSLRDTSGRCLNDLGIKLITMYKSNNEDRIYLIEETILSLIRTGIRSNNDTVKLQSISFLGILSMNCSDAHPVFRDLNLLTDKNDPEVDFFENLQHLQLHRRARALLKFCTVSKSITKVPSIKTLTQFIFPLASSYLCNEKFMGKNSIVDAAIETVGTVCRLLPWHQYSVILKYYLDKIHHANEFQRQVIRIIIAILDSFHYDLSKLKDADKNSEDSNEKVIDPPLKEIEKVDTEDSKEENKLENDEAEAEAEELLDSELAKEENKEEIIETVDCVMDKQTMLSQSAARKLVFDINNTLLPQLHRSILSRTQHEMSHKVNRKRNGFEKEDEELMRVPIALALVKLLQKLPGIILNKNLSGIFMKICTFLKSRSDSVRRSTREILEKIMITLGPDYLHYLLKEMNSLLTKGFQIHVLAYTIHAVLKALKPYLQSNHMNDNLQSVLEVCKIDLFGVSSEEKDVKAITKNVSEAKSTKSNDILRILGEHISESCLLDLIQPLNRILFNTRSHKTLMKVVDSLNNVALGLADNTFIKDDQMLIFLYGVVSKTIPGLNSKSHDKNADKNKPDKMQVDKPDCYIIQPQPKSRMGLKAASKTSADANDHVMIEFALKLLHILLKREKISGAMFKIYLDPFVPIIADCLKSQHVKLSTLSLQCLNWILKMDLESIDNHMKDICESLFSILHKYGSAGLGKGDNFDLVTTAFKTMSILVRDIKNFDMTLDQVKVLVLYVEQDLYNNDRQATAFSLLKAIIGRKIMVSEVHKVIEKVADLSVISDSAYIQQQCRAVFYKYLMEYPLGKKLAKHLSFYLEQLSYELQPGRISALEMIYNIINGFPEDILIRQSELIFLKVGVRLVNDEDPTCREFAAKCIKELITRVNHNQRLKLFNTILQWMEDVNLLHRRLAVQLCGIFVSVEKESFEGHLEAVLPLILKQFRADDSENGEEGGRFVLKKTRRNNQVDIKDLERVKDHLVFQTLQLTLKISSSCQVFLKSDKYADKVQTLGEYSQSFLAHPHLWVRLAAIQQIAFILAAIDEEKLNKIIQESQVNVGVKKPKVKDGEEDDDDDNEDDDEEEEEEEEEEMIQDDNRIKGYIYSNPIQTLRSLSLDLIAQLQPGIEFEEFLLQVVKNLIFIARVIKSMPCDNDTDKSKNISIFWLLKRIRKCVNVEVTKTPKSTFLRTAVFKWIGGVVRTIPIEPFLKPMLFQIMSPLVREMLTTEESNAPLRQLSKEVGTMIKKNIGDVEYGLLLGKVQQKLEIKKAERKKNYTQQFVVDPESAAKRKILRQQKKKEAKKRKNIEIRGKKSYGKKRKLQSEADM
ncbi:small subunit processome component 20 homolog [Microplitis mediator]|uniref:small subunit processome component 20 homolog n=1 Tax=Microplitis mediator TaxID=375433 RepID=UPI002556A31D|nr:small subunit processome component 20 homolog [Microplitis mediator]